MDFQFKDAYTISDLLEIMRILRAPDGCPWDRVQTHESIRGNFIEETYEVIEAIDKADYTLMREELGDVLMQVIFHSIMEEEAGRFTFDDVCDEVCKKLIVRHPHVFGNVDAETPEEVLRNWDAIKMQTKSQEQVADSVDDVAKSLPALMRAQKVQKRTLSGTAGSQNNNEFPLFQGEVDVVQCPLLVVSVFVNTRYLFEFNNTHFLHLLTSVCLRFRTKRESYKRLPLD